MGIIKWSKETIMALISEKGITTKIGLRRENRGAYEATYRLGIQNELGLSLSVRGRAKYTREQLIELAKPFKTKQEFQRGQSGAYPAARRMGILDEMGFECGYSKQKKWSVSAIKAAANEPEITTKKEFQIAYPGAYDASRRLGIIDELGLPDANSWELPSGVYLMRIETEQGPILKVGISCAPETRATFVSKHNTEILLYASYQTGKLAVQIEQLIHEQLSPYRIEKDVAINKYNISSGYTECFAIEALEEARALVGGIPWV